MVESIGPWLRRPKKLTVTEHEVPECADLRRRVAWVGNPTRQLLQGKGQKVGHAARWQLYPSKGYLLSATAIPEPCPAGKSWQGLPPSWRARAKVSPCREQATFSNPRTTALANKGCHLFGSNPSQPKDGSLGQQGLPPSWQPRAKVRPSREQATLPNPRTTALANKGCHLLATAIQSDYLFAKKKKYSRPKAGAVLVLVKKTCKGLFT
jgi:hypothetical protein